MSYKLQPSYLKGYISISSFIVIIQGLISVFIGMNHMIIFNTDSSWIYDYFDVTNLKINLSLYGLLLLAAGTGGMMGIFQKKNAMVFAYNIGTIVMFIYSLALLIPIVADESKGLPECATTSRFQKHQDMSIQMQGYGLCSLICPCTLNDNMKKIFTTDNLNKLVLDQNGKTQAIQCIKSQDEQTLVQNSQYYQGMIKLEKFYNCQGMCTLYKTPVYEFSDINRGPPQESTCYSELKKELDYFYTKAMSALATQIVQFILSMFIAYLQYKMHPKLHKNKNMGIYARLSQL